MKENITNQKGNPMKVYAVVKDTSIRNRADITYFTSKSKALGYIFAMMEETPRSYESNKEWYNANWCYDVHKLFNVNNWNKYKYVTDDGHTTYYIEEINVF